MNNIPFFDYPALYKRFKSEFDKIFEDVCSRGAFILQKDLEEFEFDLADYLGVKYVYGVNDGTNAMVLGLLAHNIEPNDEIIISSHTYIATAAAIRTVGAIPVFADIGSDYLFCAKSAEKKINNKTKALMPTQLNGRCTNMDKIIELANKYNLNIFEDSAQGLGAKFKNKFAGTFGGFGTYSFYPAKVLGCFGDGGAVVTNDKKIAEKIYQMRDHGRNQDGVVVSWGTNARLDNLQAAFLKLKLKNYQEDVTRRREIATIYNNNLKGNKNLYLPQPPSSSSLHFDVYQNYELAAENRDELRSYLFAKGIKTLVQWGGTPVHWLNKLGYDKNKFNDLNHTNWFFDKCLMLPLNMTLTNKEAKIVSDTILEFYEKNK